MRRGKEGGKRGVGRGVNCPSLVICRGQQIKPSMEKGPPPPYISLPPSLPPNLFSNVEDREEEKKMESGSLAKEGRGEWGGVDGGVKKGVEERGM